MDQCFFFPFTKFCFYLYPTYCFSYSPSCMLKLCIFQCTTFCCVFNMFLSGTGAPYILPWNRAGPPTRCKIESRPSSTWTIEGFLGFGEKPAFLGNLRNQLPSTKRSHFLTAGRRDTGLHWRHVPVDAYESPHQLPQASLLPDTHLLSLWRPSFSPRPAILSPLSLTLCLRLFCLLADSPAHVQSASFSLCSGLSRVLLDVFFSYS